MKITAHACLLGAILLALIVAPAAAASWMSIGAGDLTPTDRATAAYGAVALDDGGYAWIEMTEPASAWEGLIWVAAPQYWRVVRTDADGAVVWQSEDYSWTRAPMSSSGLSPEFKNVQEWYNPKISLLTNGNLLVYDSAPYALAISWNGLNGDSPARTWIREIDVGSGATLWTRDISGWAITGLVERPDGGYWASAVCQSAWYKSTIYWRANPPEATYILGLNETGSPETSYRLHVEAYRTHSSSHTFGMAAIPGSDGEYWVYGWKSESERVYTSNPSYSGLVRPQIDRINPVTRSDVQYIYETYSLTGIGTIPREMIRQSTYSGYAVGRLERPMSLTVTADGGALFTYELMHDANPSYYRLTKVAPSGGKVWSQTYVSPSSGAQMPVVEAVEVGGGSILAMFQDGDMIRVSRLDSAGTVQESILIGDPSGTVTGKRLLAAPSEGHPYGCIVTGSTTGFGASGEEALVLRLDDLEDVIYLGSGSLSLDTDVAYAAEEIDVTTTLSGADLGNVSYWVSVTDSNGTLYETWDLTTNETVHALSTLHPVGNYTLTLNTYSDDYDVRQTLATAYLQRLDVGEVAWDRDVAYLGEQVSIGYSYLPLYDRYSYWVEIRDPTDMMVAKYRLPTEGAIRPNPANLTEFGTYTAEIYPIRRSDEARIPGNVSTIVLSDETWLYGAVADIYHYPISGATIEVQQPSHPDPEVAASVLRGSSGPDGSYEVSGVVPRYPAEVTVSAAGYYDHTETIGINVSGRIHYPVYMTAIPPPPLPVIAGKTVYPPRNNPAEGLEVVLTNATTTLTETSGADGYFSFPPLAADIEYRVYARNATGHQVSSTHTYALSRGQTVDLLLLIRDESLLPYDVSFSADPTSGGAPLRVDFQATGEDVDSYHWDFGDGATATGQSVSHSYGPGLWSVTLQAENYYGVREVVKERLISVSGSGGVPAVAPTRFVVQTYSGQALANVTVTATPLESTGPLAWLLDLFGISGDVDINGTVLSGTTDTQGGIVLPLIRSVKYRIDVTDASRGIDTSITIYPQEDEVLLSVWPQEPAGAAGDFTLYAEEEGADTRVGVRYATVDLDRITFTVTTEAGEAVFRDISSAQEDDLSYLLDGDPGEVYLYGYVADLRSGEVVRQDQYIRFAQETRPWVDLAPWIPRWVYNWAAIAMIVGFSWTFGRGEVRGALLTIPILSGILWLIGWLDVSWILVGVILTLGILVYMRLSEDDLRY